MALPLSYNWHNLWVRKLSTLLTCGVVALVVFVLTVLMAFTAGIQASLAASGSPDNLVVLKPGATAESTSVIMPEEIARLVQTPGVKRNGRGEAIISNEWCTQTSILRLGPEGTLANVAIRGVDDIAFDAHAEVRIIEGRRPEQGVPELIVGKSARDRYANLQLGGKLALGRLNNRDFSVVGVFEAGGSALESEIWAGRTILADAFGRTYFSSALIKLASPTGEREASAYIKSPAVQLQAKTEPEYYGELSRTTRQIVGLTIILISIMAAGAVFAVMNTMYASVDRRLREIAMLRTLGFRRSAILTAFLLESAMICFGAAGVGLLPTVLLHGSRQDYLSDISYTVLAYEMKITPAIVAVALATATLVGVVGALSPAWRAARIQVISALRKA